MVSASGKPSARVGSLVLHDLGKEPYVVNTIQCPEIGDEDVKPRLLGQRSFYSTFFTIGDVFMALMPIAFIVLGILAAQLHGKTVENNQLGSNVAKALQLGPTIFPIVFAAVVGRGMKSIARFCAERGTTLGMLELLMSSQTVWGAFESQVLLRHLSFIGLHLLLLWSMSPLGSQATFRILHEGPGVNVSTENILYMPTGGISPSQTTGGMFMIGDSATLKGALDAVYNGVLISDKNSSQDSWGNVKIPWIKDLSSTIPNAEGWLDVPNDMDSSDAFTSNVGVPVAGLRPNVTTSFRLQYSHFELECFSMWNMSSQNRWWQEQLGAIWGPKGVMLGKSPFRKTSFFLDTNTDFGTRFNQFYKSSGSSKHALSVAKRNILFGSKYYIPPDRDKFEVILRNCTVEMPYVEANVQCKENDCQVIEMRKSAKYKDRNPRITPLDLVQVAGGLFPALPLASGNVRAGGITATELFILGSQTPLTSLLPMGALEDAPAMNYRFDKASVESMFVVPNDIFARRLGIVLNTYYMLSSGPIAFMGGLPEPPATGSWGPYSNGSATNCPTCEAGPFFGEPTTAYVGRQFQVFECNFVWFAFLMVASGALMVMGTIGTVLRALCRAPDLLGFVSSSTYDNEFIKLPYGSTLDGMDRSRKFKQLKVKIGDVWGQRDFGHVAFGRSDAVASLQRGRRYV